MGDVQKFKGANNTIMVKDAHGKIVNNIAATPLPSGNAVVVNTSVSHASRKSVDERRNIAKDLKTSPDTLAELADDEDKQIQSLLAMHPRTPYEMLVALAAVDVAHIRALVARNPATPADTLDALADDEDAWVRSGVVTNPSFDSQKHNQEFTAKIALSIVDATRESGGLSVSMIDGSTPTNGYMVARTVGVTSAIVDADVFFDPTRGHVALADFFIANRTHLTKGDYLGVWHDKPAGKIYLDVSENVSDKATAMALGSRSSRNQISIWDVEAGEEIATGGTGEIDGANQTN
jgi:pentose-5-phosphate-3-epimerase